MTKDLERDLGLVSVVAISMGAMIGSGIFILPGIAMAEAGPAVILAFVLAAVLVFPAALSIAELGTAMPEAGGDYVFIERGMGPAAGTIAGIGTWLLLMFKGALALFGGMFYLFAVLAAPSFGPLEVVLTPFEATAIVLGAVLIGVNLVGVKQTGQLQTGMVAVLLFIMAGFVVGAITEVQSVRYENFFTEGSGGLFAATATVLVSYAGVTKIAAAAEEIEAPGRNLPLGLGLSLVATSILYALIAFVLVGVVDGDDLAGTNVPMIEAVEPLFGLPGVVAIVVAAMLALLSTANAGILTASRYPLALARDDLLPERFATVHERYRTPVTAIVVTGGAMLLIIALLPVADIAKMAGSFQIIVYVLVNVALIAFRERPVEWYDPDFLAPGYPWIQLFGIASGLFIVTQMDLLPQLGGIALVVLGAAWYWFYCKPKVRREGVAVDAIRRSAGRKFVQETREGLDEAADYQLLVALRADVSREEERHMLRVAAPLVGEDGLLRVVRFEEVPDQYPLEDATAQSPDDVAFEQVTGEIAEDVGARVEVGEIVSHDTRRAVVNFATRMDADMILTRRQPVSRLGTLLGRDEDWLVEHAPCDVAMLEDGVLDDIDEIAIVTDRSPFNDPLKVEIADAIAAANDARLRFVYAVGPDAPDKLRETVRDYHADLDDTCSVPVESELIEAEDRAEALAEALSTADLVVMTTETEQVLPDLLVHRDAGQLVARLDPPVLLVHAKRSRRTSFLEPIVDRLLFRD